MKTSRFALTGAVTIAAIALAIIPWSTHISIPSVMTASQEQGLYAPFPAQIVQHNLKDGAVVKAGDVLAVLKSPQLHLRLQNAEERKGLIASRIDRSGSDVQDRASLVVLRNELREVGEEIDGLNRLTRELTLRAPFDGVVADLDTELHDGLWVNTKTPMAVLQADAGVRIKGYVSEKNLFRFKQGAEAKFIPDNPELSSVGLKVSDVAVASAERLEEPYLALRYGGSIATDEAEPKSLRPLEANYAVALVPEAANVPLPPSAVRGVSIISGAPESFYTRAKRQVLKVLVREMGV